MVVSLARGSAASGHQVAVAAAPGSLVEELDYPIFDLPVVARRMTAIPFAAWKLHRAMVRWRPDILHCHNPGVAALAALASHRGRRVPSLVSVHGVAEADYARAARVLRWSGLCVVACGPGVAAALEEHGCPVAATVVNGIPPAPEPACRDELMAQWGLAYELSLVVAVGRLVEQKNQQLVIRAIRDVPDAALVILGEGPLRSSLSALIEQLGLAERVRLVGARSDARAVMAAADCVVLGSHWEGLPLVALEALAAGAPLVATSVRGVRELLHHEIDTLLVPPDDVDQLTQAILRVLHDGALRSRLRAGGDRLVARYSEQAMTDSFHEQYEILARQRQPPLSRRGGGLE